MSLLSPCSATYLDTSAVDPLLLDPQMFGTGPFVLSEYTLAEKTRLPWDEYRAFVLAAHATGIRFLRVPPVTQIITGNFASEWEGPLELVELDVAEALNGRRIAYDGLEEICDRVAKYSADRYGQLRPHYREWIGHVDGVPETDLIDPRPRASVRAIVEAATLDALGWETPPTGEDTVAARLQWAFRSWEMAMVFVRVVRQRDAPRDLRNDPIDAVHHALASTFCTAIATADRGMARIRDIVPPPRPALLVVRMDSDGGLHRLQRAESDAEARAAPLT